MIRATLTARSLFSLTLLSLAACGGADAPAEAPEAVSDGIADIEAGLPEAPAPAGTGPWAVAAAHPLATRAGARVLAEGGSAVDAAVAVQSVLGLVEPQSSGLGGGAFMLFFDASTGTITAYDGRETAPASARPDMFLTEAGAPMGFLDAVTSGRSVGVPGVVAMLALAHERHGRLDWAGLFAEAEAHAADGFAVTPRLAGLIARLPRLAEHPGARALFFDAGGRPLRAGDTLVNAPYAGTIRALAEEGAATFYTGGVAREIVRVVNERAGPGTMSMDDMNAYRPLTRKPVCAEVAAFEVCSMGPPSSGGVTLLQILTMREAALARGADPMLAYVEASRLAYADRDRYLADPAYMGLGDADAGAVVDGMLSPTYLEGRSGLIGDAPAGTVEAGEPVAAHAPDADNAGYELPSTSHFSVRDAYGNVVSMTTSVEFAFGSHLVAGGMVLNNQLTDFAREPGEGPLAANAPAPGKRPRSSMTPVIALEGGAPVIAIGSPGGPAIIGYVAKTLAERFGGADLQAAVEAPHVVTARGGVAVETERQAERLRALGYAPRVRELTSGLYGFEVVYGPDGEVTDVLPAVDPRREGTFASGEGGGGRR